VEAQLLWRDPDRIQIPARTEDEPRFLVVGRIGVQHWSAVITYREELIRIISVRRPEMKRVKFMKAKEFDRKFDKGEDVTQFLDTSKAERPAQEQRRVNVDFPTWMIDSLDREARRLGVTRQSLIKVWIAERLEKDRPAQP
jgi:uncharacterized DUF497 family protein